MSSNKELLNVFAFPAETNGRFTLLIASTLIYTGLMGLILFAAFQITSGNFEASMESVNQFFEVSAQINNDISFIDLPDHEKADFYTAMQAPLANIAQLSFKWIFPPIVSMSALLLFAWLGYRFHPYFIHRLFRKDLQTSLDKPQTKISDEVKLISREVGIDAPQIVLHELRLTENPGAQVYGFGDNFQLRLQGILQAHKKPDQFRTMIQHELGHIVNDDIWRTQFANSLVATFSVFVLLFIGVLMFLGSPFSMLLRLTIQFMTVYVISRGIWRSVLQTREYYADWRCAVWGGRKAAILWLDGASKKDKLTFRGMIRSLREQLKASGNLLTLFKTVILINRYFFPVHPSADARIYIIKNPVKLFRIDWQLPFYSGLLLAIGILGIPFLVIAVLMPLIALSELWLAQIGVNIFSQNNPNNLAVFLLIAFMLKSLPRLLVILMMFYFIGHLITSTLGVQVQRETIADLSSQKPRYHSYRRILFSAVWLSLGIQLGMILIYTGLGRPLFSMRWGGLAWFFTFIFLTVLWLVYLRALTRTILGPYSSFADPVKRKNLILRLSNIALMLLLLPAFFLFFLTFFNSIGLPLSLFDGPEMSGSLFLFISFIVIFTMSIVCFFGGAFSLFIIKAFLRNNSQIVCETCSERANSSIAIGQNCSYCLQPLAPWFYTYVYRKNKFTIE